MPSAFPGWIAHDNGQRGHTGGLSEHDANAYTDAGAGQKGIRIMGKQVLWHYTTGQKYIKIVKSGYLLTETETTPHVLHKGDKGFVWFTASDEWEPTACKLFITPDGKRRKLSKDETEKYGEGLFRFGVYLGRGFIHFPYAEKTLGIATYRALNDVAIKQGANPALWYMYPKAIPLKNCFIIQQWQYGAWVETAKKESE